MGDLSSLNRVDVHLHGILHGRDKEHPNSLVGDGGEYAHVPDAYYDRAAKVLGKMDPDRGDVLAIEDYGFWGDGVMDQQIYTTRGISLVDALQEVEQSREDRFADVLGYVAERAVLAGLVAHRADARRDEIARLESLERSESDYERETLMLQRLGAIANGMPNPTPNGERALLAFVCGSGHLKTLSARLNAVNIPHTTNRNPSFAPTVDIARFLGWEILDRTKSLFGFGLAQRLEKRLTP